MGVFLAGTGVLDMIFAFITFLSKELGGYGWALVALGVITRLALAPLYQAQIDQMKKMQKVKPLMDKLQKKYKDNPEELSKRMMDLFKQHNVNPFGGCLVAILQLPILIAIYRAIQVNINVFENQSFLWITSLAKPDLLLFTIYIISMYLTMELTPSPGISQEEKARMRTTNIFMILFLAFLLRNFASAFILYWLAYNLASLIHTLIAYRPEVSTESAS